MDTVDILLAHHIKPSVQRMAIMDYLMAHYSHPTVEEIYSALSPTMPTLSKTTVYNTLKLLTDQGAVRMLSIDERFTCYDVHTEPHAHFLCRKCGQVYDLPLPDGPMNVETADQAGHDVEEIHYYYRGVCKQCRLTDCSTDSSAQTEVTKKTL